MHEFRFRIRLKRAKKVLVSIHDNNDCRHPV